MAQHEEDGILYSGLETKGLKRMGCSLLLPKAPLEVECTKLFVPPQTVTVKIDFGSPHYSVDFPGAGVIGIRCSALQPSATKRNLSSNRAIFLAGKCRYTPADHKDFSIMMRSKKDGKAQGLGANSDYSWPGVESFELCPACGTTNKAAKRSKEYYMVFQLLMSQGHKARATKEVFIATRLHPQLACAGCIEGLLKDKTLKAGTSYPESVIDSVNQMPGMPIFVGANISCHNVDGKTVGSAWPLYLKWTNTGTFDALALTLKSNIGNITGKEGPQQLADPKAKKCLVCKVKLLPKTAKVCGRCSKATYCSKACQVKDWKRHKMADCVSRQVEPEFHSTTFFTAGASPICRCQVCHATGIDQGLMLMCFACGTVKMCQMCGEDGDYDDLHVGPSFCQSCVDAEPQFRTQPIKPISVYFDKLMTTLPDDAPQRKLVRLMIAQCRLHDTFEETGYTQDTRFAKTEILDLADAGYYQAQSLVADYYMRDILGEGHISHGPLYYLDPPRESDIPFAIDHAKAKHYHLQGLETGFPVALNEVGLMYKNGVLFPTNKRRALELFERAVAAGNAKAMCNAAQLYYRGDGTPSDMAKAILYYKRAANSHNKDSAKFMLLQLNQVRDAGGFLSREEIQRYMHDVRESGFLDSLPNRKIFHGMAQAQGD